MADPKLLSLQVGMPETLDAGEQGTPWTTGLFKQGVSGAVWLGATNLAGDGQADLKNHGGPDKAVNVYAAEHYPFWRADLGLPSMAHGAFGENFTLSGILEGEACIGDVFEIGEARVQVSQPRGPCWKLARRWGVPDFVERIRRHGSTGWYLRVLEEGYVEAGQALHLVDRPCPNWTIARTNGLLYGEEIDREAIASLVANSLLAAPWRASLARRLGESR